MTLAEGLTTHREIVKMTQAQSLRRDRRRVNVVPGAFGEFDRTTVRSPTCHERGREPGVGGRRADLLKRSPVR